MDLSPQFRSSLRVAFLSLYTVEIGECYKSEFTFFSPESWLLNIAAAPD